MKDYILELQEKLDELYDKFETSKDDEKDELLCEIDDIEYELERLIGRV
jgi:hypothetical protein